MRSATPDLESIDTHTTLTARRTWYETTWTVCKRHSGFVGPGILASVAYFDPGNWATDLSAGSQFGYHLLFVVLLAGLVAILFQVLSSRLGVVTGTDLAQHLRARFHDRPKHKLLWRWGCLYLLYFLSEIAIIATDIAELLGSAIALNLLFPKLPLYGGVLVTAADVLLILVAYRPDGGIRSMRIFEILITCLVVAVFMSFIVLLCRISPDWGLAFAGYLPSRTLVKPSALYASVGIVGATVMPHSLFLGSRIATIDRLNPAASAIGLLDSQGTTASEGRHSSLAKALAKVRDLLRHDPQQPESKTVSRRVVEDGSEGVSVFWIKTHLLHATIDIVLSLFCFAVTINSAILIVAAAAFYYGIAGQAADGGVGDLFDAYGLIKQYIGKGSAFLFAFALLCAGQSASISATLAGQVVSEGFLRWKLSPFLRRIITRCIGIIPSVTISIALGRDGLDTLLIGSQVVLSLVLPFVAFPLIFLTSSASGVMKVQVERSTGRAAHAMTSLELPTTVEKSDKMPMTPLPYQAARTTSTSPARSLHPTDPQLATGSSQAQPAEESDSRSLNLESVDFSSHWTVTSFGYLLFLVMVAANCYVLVEIGLGNS